MPVSIIIIFITSIDNRFKISRLAAFTIFQAKDGKPSQVEFAGDSIKAALVTRSQVPDPGPAYIHFSSGEGAAAIQWSSFDCLKTFCCERRTEKTINGYTECIWTKPAHQRNKGIDTLAYARGVLLHLGRVRILEYQFKRQQKLKETPKPKEKVERPASVSVWLRPVVTDTKLRAEQTGKVASGHSRWVPET